MSLRGDDRAQSVQIGAAILLAFVVLAIASYQASVVPTQNEQVEFNHNQEVQSQMQDLRGGIVSVPGGGNGRSVSVKLGTRYPERTLFVNPGPPSGNLRTTQPDRIAIQNATATGETGDYWNGTTRNVSTRGLVYTADYAVWQNAPRIAYENSVTYNDYRADTIVESDQRLVRGRQITVVALNGSYQEASTRTVSVDLEAVSSSSNVVTVENTTGENVTLRFPTRLNETKWTELLEEQRTTNGGHVVDVSVEPGSPYDELVLVLERGESYRLRMAKVGVGTNVEETGASYITDGGGASIPENTTTELEVEVRDEFNNPVSGEGVDVSTKRPDSSVRAVEDQSDADGTVTLVYEAPADVSKSQVTDRVNATYDGAPGNSGFDGTKPENVQINVTVRNDGGGGSATSPLAWNTTDIENQPGIENCTADTCRYNRSKGPANDKIDFSVNTSPTRVGLQVDFSTDDGAVVMDFSPTQDTTDADGELVTTLKINTTGTAELFADSLAGSDSLTLNVVDSGSNSPPTASFTFSPSSPDTGENINFDASGSSDPDGSITSYAWDFGDGNTGTGQMTTHSYSSSGTYTVTLTVTDDEGAADTFSDTITVSSNAPPAANFTYSPTNPDTGETVSFDASSSSDSDGSISTYEWDFDGDGTTDATGETTSTTYADDGNYDVTLTVTDDDGATDSETKTVNVQNRPPAVDLTANRTTVETGEAIEFDASGSSDPDGSIATYYWDFDGDGTNETTTSTPTVDHSYSDDGTYSATVTVEDNDGATNATSISITVQNRPPTANFIDSCIGLNCTFDASSSTDPDGTVDQYEWNFDDGTTTTTTDPVVNHEFASAGTYDVTLSVTDDDGATNTTTRSISVSASSGDNITRVSGSTSADTFSSTGGQSDTGSLQFDIENTGSVPATITGFKIEQAGSADHLESDHNDVCQDDPGKDDLYVDASTDGCADKMSPREYDIGTKYSMTDNATLNGGTTAMMYFYQFRDSSDNPVSLSGETFEVVLYFADGSSTTITISVP